MKYILTYTTVLMSLVSVLHASPTRVTIDPEKRKKSLEKLFAGDVQMFGMPEVQLYGAADFYVLLDRIVDYPKNDEGKKLSDVAVALSDLTRNNAEPMWGKKPPHHLSLVLVSVLDGQKDTKSLQEIIECFD